MARPLIAESDSEEYARWVPPPRYLLRKHCVLSLLRGVKPCRVLEIGCGAGDLLAALARGVQPPTRSLG